jgi:hypothetical protein
MKNRNGRRFCLGFQWDTASWEDAPAWIDSLFGLLGGQRVHWNLSVSKRRPSLIKALRTRVEAKGDMISAIGFAGACHPLLNLDELEKELSWLLKNPWETGITDQMDLRPTILIPRMADLARPDAWKLYCKHGFALIGIGGLSGSPLIPVGGCFTVTRLRIASGENPNRTSRQLRRLLATRGDIFVLLDLSGLKDAGPLESIIGELSDRERFSLITEVEHSTTASAPPPGAFCADWSSLPLPTLHSRLDAIAGIARKKKKKNEEYCELLSALGREEAVPSPDSGRAEGSANAMRLVAHMQGEVTLAGRAFDVRLHGGRFHGITRRGVDLLPAISARSYVRVDRTTTHFKTRSSFSFEGEDGTGLREELGFGGQDGALLSIEYSFRDDTPFLQISVEICYPRMADGATVEEYAPFGLVLKELARGEEATVEASAPDGSASSIGLSGNGSVVLPGAEHRVKLAGGGCIVLCYAPREARRWGIPSFRVIRVRGRRLLEVNPFGSYAPTAGAALGGKRETFCLLLGVEEA